MRQSTEIINEKDFGIVVDSSMKFSEQCNIAMKNANTILGLIRRTIKCKLQHIIMKLYKALVRPKLEYCIQVWRPYLKKNIDNIDKVQHRATKMIEECKHLNYEDRLIQTGLTTLDESVFKMIKGFNKAEYRSFYTLSQNSRTRGHRFK